MTGDIRTKASINLLGSNFPQCSFPSPWPGLEQKSSSQVPTPSNKLEADYTGTRPGDGPRRAGCTCGPPAPSLRRGGRGAALIPRPAHPAREAGEGEAFLEKLKGSPSGLAASKARHRTPTSGKNRPSRNRVSPPSRLRGRGREEGARARGGAGGRQSTLSSLSGPTARARRIGGARRSRCPERHHPPGPGGRRREPRAPPPPTARAPRREFPAAGQDACSGGARLGSGAAPTCAAPAPAGLAPTLGRSPCSLAAEPRLMLRREVAASPAAGGGCTGTRRGGEGARRPGPCSRGPARGCHLEARRRSRGTTGGGSGGDGSSST